MKYILFDLDGTIINSYEGITKCVKYALESVQIYETDHEKLKKFIGPPLLHSFQELYDLNEEQAEQLVEKYRERYHTIGWQECELYDGVEETLIHLKERGYKIGLASSKPEQFCKKILDYFQINMYFDEITGAELLGSRNEKVDVIYEAMRRFDLQNKKDILLVGDTKYDAIGANEAGIACLGVSYGFGSVDDLKENNVVKIVNSMKEVEKYFEK